MARFIYTPEMLDYLRVGYREMRKPELTDAFNRAFGLDVTVDQIKSTLQNHKIRCGRPTGLAKGERFRIFTHEQADFVREKYKELTQVELAAAVNEKYGLHVTPSQIRSFTRNHSICSGRTGCFEKGSRPWNTGTKGICKANSGTFLKGNIPGNLKPLGDERICTKDGYVLIKIAEKNPYTGAPTRYKAKHVVIWEKEHGKVPKGHMIRFIDCIKTHCSIDNLVMICQAENQYLNKMGYCDLPDDAKPAMLTLAKLMTKSKQLERKAVNE